MNSKKIQRKSNSNNKQEAGMNSKQTQIPKNSGRASTDADKKTGGTDTMNKALCLAMEQSTWHYGCGFAVLNDLSITAFGAFYVPKDVIEEHRIDERGIVETKTHTYIGKITERIRKITKQYGAKDLVLAVPGLTSHPTGDITDLAHGALLFSVHLPASVTCYSTEFEKSRMTGEKEPEDRHVVRELVRIFPEIAIVLPRNWNRKKKFSWDDMLKIDALTVAFKHSRSRGSSGKLSQKAS